MNQKKKDFSEFINDVMKEIQKRIDRSYTVSCQTIEKNNNAIVRTIMISDHIHNTSPCYYMEHYYELYEKPEDAIAIVKDIINIHNQTDIQNFPMEWITHKDTALEHVMFRIVSTDKNTALLDNAPHYNIPGLNLSMLFHLAFADGQDYICMLIQNHHMKIWEPGEMELLKHAWQNTLLTMGHTIVPLTDILNCSKFKKLQSFWGERMYIVTNKHWLYGAGCILYPEILEKISKMTGKNFYILPSSIHETIVLTTDRFDENYSKWLKWMVMDINQTALTREEILSDDVYYYSHENHKLSLTL